MKAEISPSQLRAARALIGWSRERLARAAKMTSRTITRIEAAETEPYPRTVSAIRAALEEAGVEFIDQSYGGAGVRLKASTKLADLTVEGYADA